MTHSWMPMKLAESTRLECHNSRCNGFRDGEVARINDLNSTSWSGDWFVVPLVPYERAVSGQCLSGMGNISGADGGVDNSWLRFKRGIKGVFWKPEVLGQNGFWSMRNPVVDLESCPVPLLTIVSSYHESPRALKWHIDQI